MAWAGFDAVSYPGDPVMQELWESSPLAWTGFRLGPSAQQLDDSWMKSYQTLAGQGWGIAPIYAGRKALGAGDPATGARDGQEAVTLAAAAGLPSGGTLFLHHDGETADDASLTYVEAWLAAVAAAGWRAGLRARPAIAERFTGRDPAIALWVIGGGDAATSPGDTATAADFRPQPAPDASGVAEAVLWRHTAREDSPPLTGGGTTDLPAFSIGADWSSAVMANPLVASAFALADDAGGGGAGSGTATTIPAASAFPFSAVSIVIKEGPAKGQTTKGISDSLAAARTAKRLDPKLKIAVFDMTDGGLDYGGLNDNDMVFTASLNKIAALAAAYALREALIAAINGVPAATPKDLLAAVEAAWGAKVRKRFA